MTTPTPAPAGLDELDALLTAALSVRNNYPSSPKLEALHDDGESQVILAWSDGATADFVETFDAETADLIAVTINRAPAMLAAIRAAYALAEELDGPDGRPERAVGVVRRLPGGRRARDPGVAPVTATDADRAKAAW